MSSLAPRTDSDKLLPSRTAVQQRAALAQRPLRAANPPPVLDQRDVERVDLLRFQYRLEDIVRLCRARLRRHKAQPLSDAMDVRIDRQRRPPEREHQHAGRRLRPNPLQLAKPALRLL